jgi:hypothetical protein
MSDVDLSKLLSFILGVDSMKRADLVSPSMITQIESNLQAKTSFSVGSALTSMTQQNG